MDGHNTYKEYFDDTYKFTGLGTILEINASEKPDEFAITLDKTIFHPQGGG